MRECSHMIDMFSLYAFVDGLHNFSLNQKLEVNNYLLVSLGYFLVDIFRLFTVALELELWGHIPHHYYYTEGSRKEHSIQSSF